MAAIAEIDAEVDRDLDLSVSLSVSCTTASHYPHYFSRHMANPRPFPANVHRPTHSRGSLANLRPWQKGQSGNPRGMQAAGGAMYEAMRLAREASPDSIRTLIELRDNSQDERVRAYAANSLLDRGLGKPKEAPVEAKRPQYDMSHLSAKEREQVRKLASKIVLVESEEGGSEEPAPRARDLRAGSRHGPGR